MTATSPRGWLGCVLLLVLTPAGARAQQAPYVDPVLRLLLRPGVEAMLAEALRAQAALPVDERAVPELTSVAVSGTAEAPRIGILARMRGPAALAALRGTGAEIGAIVGDIVSASVPLGSLAAIAADADFEVVQAARVLRAVHDSSMRAINAHLVRQPAGGAWTGFAGSGAIVGIYDTGLDFTHQDFRRPDESTRVLGLWDQTLSGVPPAGFSYGVYCDPATLDAASCPQRDTFGHGTHVTGSAAGDGSGGTGSPFQYAGVAPLADLLIVKGGNGSFAENRIIDGIDWLFREAERLGKPAVVNLSLGGQFGPHDGTRLFEEAIDQLSGTGRVVVASAGNDGSNRNTLPPLPPEFVHADGLPSAGPATFTIQIPAYSPRSGECNDVALIDLWYEAGDALSIQVRRPDGTSATAGFAQTVFDDHPTGQIAIENAPGGQPYPGNGDFETLIRIGDCDASGPAVAGQWTVIVTPTAAASGRPYHMWIVSSDFGGELAFGTTGFSNRVVIGSPGNARRAVTVGGFVTRVCFPSQTGQTLCAASPEELGDIASFSAAGPTRDDRLKPEITAPGRLIISALSSATQPQSNLVTPDGAHWVLQGTSMAAPHVTGSIAILLQVSPDLTPEAVKDVLAASAKEDAFTRISFTGEPEGVPNNQWGHGKLDVQAALAEIGALGVVATVTIAAEPLAPPAAPSSRAGTRIPLLGITLSVQGTGPARIDALGFEATGNDPAAKLVVLRDANGNQQIDEGESTVASATLALTTGQTERLTVPTSLVIAPGETAHLIAALEPSGQVPHNTAFSISYVPAATTASAASGEGRVLLDQPSAPIASASIRTSVLAADQVVSLSENPIRSNRVIINFRQIPSTAAVYTTAGRHVTNLLTQGSALRREWDLTNEEGTRLAPGVYLLIVTVANTTERLKVIVLPTSGS
jgi:minor extracellular serine protease Vpr